MIKRALLSVSDKTGLAEFAAQLHELNIEILSTGGTAKLLQENNIPVIQVSDYTGAPEIMGGRVKTLHPKIHGGILRRPGVDDEVLVEQGIGPIDLVVVNLYPFTQVTADPNCPLSDAIENIDIGGPTMVRAAAKNHNAVAVVVDSNDYPNIIEELKSTDGIAEQTRFNLAKKAFAHTAAYDAAISNYLSAIEDNGERSAFPETFTWQLHKKQDLRYGENSHQNAALYTEANGDVASVAHAEQLQGKALSYNNIADTNAALECVKAFHEGPACVIVKHANPCGVAFGDDQLNAYERAFSTDPTSAFGGIIAFNKALNAQTAQAIIDKQFVEVIIAPEVDKDALTILESKPNVRVLTCGDWPVKPEVAMDCKRVLGGLLIQDLDIGTISEADLKVVSKREPSSDELKDLLFAWRVAKYVKSNAIVYVKDQMTVGVGAGQMSRVYSAKIAGIKAEDEGLQVPGSVMASDAFFPFRDGIDAAAKAGITAVIQPGGSIRDEEVIRAADEAGIAMVFTGMRHFWH